MDRSPPPPSSRHAPLWRGLLVTVPTLLALVACGGAEPDATATATDIAVLADRAERLADHLDAGDGCAAEREGGELLARAHDGVEAGTVDETIAAEVQAVVDDVTAAVPCEDDDADEAEQADETEADDADEGDGREDDGEDDKDDGEDDKDDNKGRGRGNEGQGRGNEGQGRGNEGQGNGQAVGRGGGNS